MTTHVVWLRNDLRVTDNRALHAACQDPQALVLALFIATPGQWQQHDMAPCQAVFLWQNLQVVQQMLAQRGIPLHYHQCDDFNGAVTEVAHFCQQYQVSHLFYNRQYELNERRRDQQVEQALQGVVECQGFDDSVLLPPGCVTTHAGEMYKVYTPFRRAFIKRLLVTEQTSLPAPVARLHTAPAPLDPLTPFPYPQFEQLIDSHEVDSAPPHFPAGEEAARQRLRDFCRQRVVDYADQRNLPAIAGTSTLSPYLALGVLSPRQCINRLRLEHPDCLENQHSGAFCWLNELIWREFYRHLLVVYPALSRHQPFLAWTDKVHWRCAPDDLLAWQQGKTGYPIVDAAMRQLNTTGWIHNRLRMITASFLVKDLLIDWREGERYFMSRLLDGDLAANNGGWQWAASTGTDAAPYFRIFNPTTQGERFDPNGAFIRRWVPELAQVPDSAIHQPQRWAAKQGMTLHYPAPIVDHAKAREATLAAFAAAKACSQTEVIPQQGERRWMPSH